MQAIACGKARAADAARRQARLGKASRKRFRLWLKWNKQCYWCGCGTLFPGIKPDGGLYRNAATIDHVYSRLSEERFRGNHQIVLACNECNARRCKEECRERFGSDEPKPPKMLAQVLITWTSVP